MEKEAEDKSATTEEEKRGGGDKRGREGSRAKPKTFEMSCSCFSSELKRQNRSERLARSGPLNFKCDKSGILAKF